MHSLLLKLILILLIELQSMRAFTKLTNLQCESYDKSFGDFSVCKLTVPERGKIALHAHFNLYKLPVNNVSVNLGLYKRLNGYHPFMYNITVNYCEFLANKRRYPFLKIVLDFASKNSNINHTCPYNHDIIVDGLIVNDDMFRMLPLPDGTYMFQAKVSVYNVLRAGARIYVLRQE